MQEVSAMDGEWEKENNNTKEWKKGIRKEPEEILEDWKRFLRQSFYFGAFAIASKSPKQQRK